ncbi:MAG: tyrosine-type recombinase/integrase [Desulfobulbaceae bacterium]
MKRNKLNFTMARLNNLQPDPEKRTYYFDSAQPGLRIAVTPAGGKSYQFQHWSKSLGKPVSKTIGKFDRISLDAARKEAARLLAEVNEGINIEDQIREKRAEPTFSNAFNRFLDGYAKIHKRSWEHDEHTYKNYLKPVFGNVKVSQITHGMVKTWHAKLGRSSGKYMANRALALMSAVYNRELPAYGNPCVGVKKFKEVARDRFLQPDELKKFFESLQKESQLFQDVFLVMLLTGARKSNVLSMKWNEVQPDRGLWVIPAEKSKNDEPMQVPLVKPVLDILARRKKETSSIFVFPGRGRTGHTVEPKSAWKRVVKRASLEDVRMHDLRRTMGSYQTITGSSSTIVGKTLGHKSQQSTAIYARLNLDPIRTSMENAVEEMMKNG